MWIGALLSTTGTWMQTVAQSWVVLSLTKSAFYLGLDAFLATSPMILFSLLGGVVADRFPRRRILLLSQYLQMTFAFIMAVLIYTKTVKVWHIFILSFLTGTAQSFGGPAYQALIPLLVDREQMTNAIALNSMQFNLARMMGPVLAGIALSTVGAAWCFGLNGLSFVAVIISLLMIRVSFTGTDSKGKSILTDMKEGFRFMGEHPAIRELTLIAFVTTFFGIPLVTLMPLFAKSIFNIGPKGFGWMMAASGAGSVTGALLVAGSNEVKRKGRLALLFQLSFCAFLVVFAVSRNFWLSIVAIFFSGSCLLGVVTTVSSLVQLKSTEAMRGRVMSIFMMAFRGGMPLGSLLSGWVAERFSVTRALLMNAGCLALIALGFLVSKNKLKEI